MAGDRRKTEGKAQAWVDLPPRQFFYTLDQIAELLSMSTKNLRANYVYFDRVTPTLRRSKQLMARNIAEHTDKPDWRVAEDELVRWMRACRFRYGSRGWS